MSEFHEEFEAEVADSASATAGPRPDDMTAAEPETADIDADAAVEAGDPAAPGADGTRVREGDPSPDDPEAGTADGTDSPSGAEDPEDRAAEYLALAQRTKADFDNFRKRAARDAALAAERGTIKLARELLPALDNLERAIAHAPAEDPLLEGIKLVHSDLLGALSRAGIESYSPAGESFDPQLHEAVAQHAQEGAAAGTVLEVYQQGYRTADTVLRPARVLVAA